MDLLPPLAQSPEGGRGRGEGWGQRMTEAAIMSGAWGRVPKLLQAMWRQQELNRRTRAGVLLPVKCFPGRASCSTRQQEITDPVPFLHFPSPPSVSFSKKAALGWPSSSSETLCSVWLLCTDWGRLCQAILRRWHLKAL